MADYSGTPSLARRRRNRRRAQMRRRRAAVGVASGVALMAIPAGIAAMSTSTPDAGRERITGRLVFRDAATPVAAIELDRHVMPRGELDKRRLRAAIRDAVPTRRTVRHRRTRLSYRLDRSRAVRSALRLGPAGGTVPLVRRRVSSRISAPVVAQKLRNNCESAALEVLLATTGVRTDQLQLQSSLPRSGQLDPRKTAEGRIWGDPEVGYVGRPDGGGVAGGFGVYEAPVRKVARDSGRDLDDLSRSAPARIYDRLRAGRAVMAWVGLSEGPYGNWRSPSGRDVRVNFGEHTVVLVGITSGGSLRVVNPLEGTRETWSAEKFERMWELLGRRALAVSRKP